jgi:hypothetical protein
MLLNLGGLPSGEIDNQESIISLVDEIQPSVDEI